MCYIHSYALRGIDRPIVKGIYCLNPVSFGYRSRIRIYATVFPVQHWKIHLKKRNKVNVDVCLRLGKSAALRGIIFVFKGRAGLLQGCGLMSFGVNCQLVDFCREAPRQLLLAFPRFLSFQQIPPPLLAHGVCSNSDGERERES